MTTRRDFLETTAGLSSLVLSGIARDVLAADGRMALCIHTNTSHAAGYRGALEGWAKAGIRNVELNANLVDDFLRTDTLVGARNVLTDNGLTPVHGAVSVGGLLVPNPDHDEAVDNLKRRLEMFATLGLGTGYTTSGGRQQLGMDDYPTVVDNMRIVGETAMSFDMQMNVEFVRSSTYMSTLLTGLKLTRDAGHPNLGLMFDFYHFWSGLNRLEDMDEIRPGEIKHVHFQDVPDIPREMLDQTSRIIPGDGIAPLNAMLGKLAAKEYAGPLSVELFLPEFRERDPYEVASEIREKCERVMSSAGVL
jgi:4-hydroxyphenylpyruvate dioxygenase